MTQKNALFIIFLAILLVLSTLLSVAKDKQVRDLKEEVASFKEKEHILEVITEVTFQDNTVDTLNIRYQITNTLSSPYLSLTEESCLVSGFSSFFGKSKNIHCCNVKKYKILYGKYNDEVFNKEVKFIEKE